MALKNFAPLSGRWRVAGGAEGEIVYRWADAERRFLFQDFNIHVFNRHLGLQVIGHLQGLPPSSEI